MKFKALVARTDGSASAGFAPGSIPAVANIPVTREFDPRNPPIGRADLVVEGDRVYAEIELFGQLKVGGLYPALGVIQKNQALNRRRDEVVTECDVLTVGLCQSRNMDPEIPPLEGGGSRQEG